MNKTLIIIATAISSTSALADNYATCLLDKMPGLQNESAAHAAMQVCLSNHPQGFAAIPQGEGRGFFGYDSGAECALEKSAATISRAAAYQIRLACNKLYDKPKDLFDEFSLEHPASTIDRFLDAK